MLSPLYCRKKCLLEGFAIDPLNLHLCPLEVTSICPDYFSDWKMNNQCLTDPTTYLHDQRSDRVFRNTACTVCNGVVQAELLFITGSPQSVNVTKIMTSLYQVSREDQFSLHLRKDSAECCCSCSSSERWTCIEVNVTNWGSLMHPKTLQCQVVPFRADCDQVPIFTIGQTFSLEDLCPDFNIMCPSYPAHTTTPTTAKAEILAARLLSRMVLLVSRFSLMVSSRQIVKKTEWVEDNSTYLLCGNESIRNPLTGNNYKTLQLHQGMVKVRQNTELKNIAPTSKVAPNTNKPPTDNIVWERSEQLASAQ